MRAAAVLHGAGDLGPPALGCVVSIKVDFMCFGLHHQVIGLPDGGQAVTDKEIKVRSTVKQTLVGAFVVVLTGVISGRHEGRRLNLRNVITE